MQKLFYKMFLAVCCSGLLSCTHLWGDTNEEKSVAANEQKAYYESGSFNGISMPRDEAYSYANNPEKAASVFNKRVPPLNSLIVCRDKQCAPAELSKSKEYIFNALAQLIDNNLDKTALLCEANAQTHVCTNPYVSVPAKIGVTPAYVFFDGVKIVDASLVDGQSAINLALDYNLSYNGQTPTVCKPDTAMIYVKNNNKVVLNGNGFKCDMTSVGVTMIRVMFNVDYVDLDYGYIGGYYSIGLSGPAYGGGSGYSLIRLPKDAHPLSPVLQAPRQETVDTVQKPVFKPEVNETVLEIKEDNQGLAPVEVRISGESEQPSEALSVKPERKIDNSSSFNASDDRNYINTAQPVDSVSKKPTVAVEDGGFIVKSEQQNASNHKSQDTFGPEFEEVYIDDLDEYIK